MLHIFDAFSSSDEAQARNRARFYLFVCIIGLVFLVLTIREFKYLIFSTRADVKVVQVTDGKRSSKVVTDLLIAGTPATYDTSIDAAPAVGTIVNLEYIADAPDSARDFDRKRLLLFVPFLAAAGYLTFATVSFWRDFQKFQARKRASDD
ncbi:MAG TPA: hypothetical protein VK157_04030 [Phycisphaerales bacterium]|nr:hypothetical protein [Phycisphaerales bacterium]